MRTRPHCVIHRRPECPVPVPKPDAHRRSTVIRIEHIQIPVTIEIPKHHSVRVRCRRIRHRRSKRPVTTSQQNRNRRRSVVRYHQIIKRIAIKSTTHQMIRVVATRSITAANSKRPIRIGAGTRTHRRRQCLIAVAPVLTRKSRQPNHRKIPLKRRRHPIAHPVHQCRRRPETVGSCLKRTIGDPVRRTQSTRIASAHEPINGIVSVVEHPVRPSRPELKVSRIIHRRCPHLLRKGNRKPVDQICGTPALRRKRRTSHPRRHAIRDRKPHHVLSPQSPHRPAADARKDHPVRRKRVTKQSSRRSGNRRRIAVRIQIQCQVARHQHAAGWQRDIQINRIPRIQSA